MVSALAAGQIDFGEVVGIERYHADYSRGETAYYAADGGSCVVTMSLEHAAIATELSGAKP